MPVRTAEVKKKKITIPNAGEDEEKLDLSSIVGGNRKRYSHCRKEFGSLLKKLNILLPYNPAITILGIYPRDMSIDGHTKKLHECS